LVRRSLKANLSLIKSKDPKTANVLFDLQKETAKRHGFVGFSKKLFENEIEIFSGDNMSLNFICKEGDRTLASAIIIFYGEKAYYHFSGSTSEHTQVPFMYYLLWQAILEAKKRGIKIFDFWGIAPNDNPRHRFAGVTLFKTGFGGYRVDWLHAHDLVVSPLYNLTYLFEVLRKLARRL
jgi:lipid II:glycine glycyltransferase (peptidoglycan interpeptide bridge formation enzyme)